MRVLSAFFASAAMAGAFVCAVAVVKPGAGADPRWPHGAVRSAVSAPALRMPVVLPRADVLSAIALRTRLPAAATATPPGTLLDDGARVGVVRPTAPVPPNVPAPVTTAPPSVATPAATAQQGPEPPVDTPVARDPARAAAADTVSSSTRTVATTVAPVSPEPAGTVQQTGDTVAGIINGG